MSVFRLLILLGSLLAGPLVGDDGGSDLVTWTNEKLADDGVLQPKVGAISGVSIVASPSRHHESLRATKAGVKQIEGNSAVYFVEGDEDLRGEEMAAAAKKNRFVEFAFEVRGLAEGTKLRVTGFSYEYRPNGNRAAEVYGAESSRAQLDGEWVGSLAIHEKMERGINATSDLVREYENGDVVRARVYLAGFDSEGRAGVEFSDFHRGIRIGNVRFQGEVVGERKPLKLTRADLPSDVHSVLEKHCLACHGAEKQKGKVRFDTLSSDFVHDRAAAETWHDAMDVVSIGEMPPEDEPELSSEERRILTGWIRKNIEEAIAATTGKGDGVILRRLNKVEYRNTLVDLLGVEGDYGARLPEDPVSEEGFFNNGDALGMSALQVEYYLEAAREALGRTLVEGAEPKQTVEIANESIKLNGLATGTPSSRLGRVHYFVSQVQEVPRNGDFLIRVRARVESGDGRAAVLGVDFGNKISGAISFFETVGTAEVLPGESREYEFRGRVEDFPLIPVGGDKYQQLILVRNLLDDGVKPPKPEKKDKKKGQFWPEDPDFPQLIIESVEFVGNAHDAWPPEPHRRIFFAAEDEESPEYLREVLQRFLQRAWRRPVSEDELARYFRHFESVSQQSSSRVGAMRETLAAALASPNFLYLAEPRVKDEFRPLNDWELAARFSYFLWSSMPDERLFELAGSGTLGRPETLSAEVDRMLADPRSERFIDQFTTQWLDLGGLERVAVNPQFYPNFDDSLKADMVQESQRFFAEILREDLSALQLIDADWTMLNAPLARHYGIHGPTSQKFVRVSLAGTDREGGLLGHAAMHLANSDGEDSHPINRAVWIRERILHDPPLPPPPNVPALDTANPDFAKLSVREQLEIHRKDAACGDCHRGIDPWGIALDHYDAVGLWRDEIRRPTGKGNKFENQPVDARDTLPGGVEIDGLEDLKAYLMTERREQFAHALVAKLLTFSLGRSLELSDEPIIDELAADFEEHEYRLTALLKAIVLSEPFLTR